MSRIIEERIKGIDLARAFAILCVILVHITETIFPMNGEYILSLPLFKNVIRDRASAYASAIQEILPDAMQIADRFYLHQNLLEAIKNTVNGKAWHCLLSIKSVV